MQLTCPLTHKASVSEQLNNKAKSNLWRITWNSNGNNGEREINVWTCLSQKFVLFHSRFFFNLRLWIFFHFVGVHWPLSAHASHIEMCLWSRFTSALDFFSFIQRLLRSSGGKCVNSRNFTRFSPLRTQWKFMMEKEASEWEF